MNQKYKTLINLTELRLRIRQTENYCDINYNNISNRIKNVFGFTNILTLNILYTTNICYVL